MDRYFKQNINKAIKIFAVELSWYFQEIVFQKNENTYSFQVHMEHSLEQTIDQDTEQASTNLRRQELFKHLFWPQWQEIRNQQQKEKQKQTNNSKQLQGRWTTCY